MEQPIVVPHDGNPAIELLPYPWPKRTIAFDLALRQLQNITNGKLLPWDLKAEVKCLTKLGSKKPQKGFVRRPVMTFAKETLNCIQKGYNKGGEFKLDHKSGEVTDHIHTCQIQMTPEEAAEEPFHRFKWHR